MSNRIRWEDKTPGNGDVYNIACIGYAGAVDEPAFIIYTPDDLHDNWLLSVRLVPGSRFLYGASADELKAEAGRWLSGFVSSLGAVFPEDGSDCPAVTRLEVIDHTTGSKHLISYLPDVPRAFVAYGIKAETSFQDGGRTLKVFLTDPQTPPDTAATAGETE